MEITGYKSEEELNELLDAGKITTLTYVTKQSAELTKEFEDFCSDRELEKTMKAQSFSWVLDSNYLKMLLKNRKSKH